MQTLRTWARRLLIQLLLTLSSKQLGDFAYQVVSEKVKTLSGEEALRLLFTLDTRFYYLEKKKAVEYGDGLHPKHRHMKYHDFFVSRVLPGSKVLDVGCGNGAVAYDVAIKRNANLVAIDLNEASILEAREKHSHPQIRYIVGDATKDLTEEKFDYVILSNVLEHIIDRKAFLLMIQESSSPDCILIRIPTFERDWRVPLKRELGLEWRLDVDHKTEYTIESFNTEMTEAGLRITHQEGRWGEIWAEVVPYDT